MPMTDKQLASRDAKRNLGAELLQSVHEMKAGKGKVVARAKVPAVTHEGLIHQYGCNLDPYK